MAQAIEIFWVVGLAVTAAAGSAGLIAALRHATSTLLREIRQSLSAERARLLEEEQSVDLVAIFEEAVNEASSRPLNSRIEGPPGGLNQDLRVELVAAAAEAAAQAVRDRQIGVETTALVNEYHARSLSQSQISFYFSLAAATVGFAFIIASAVTAGFGGSEKVDVALVQGIGGVVVELVAALFFRMSNESRKLLVDFFDKLRVDEQSKGAIEMAHGMSLNSPTRDRLGLLHDQVTGSVTRPDWPVGS